MTSTASFLNVECRVGVVSFPCEGPRLMSRTRALAADDRPIEGVFVLGMYDSGVELVHALLNRMGLRSVHDPADGAIQPLGEFNDRLLQAIGGSREHLPEIPSREAARMLGQFADEARSKFCDSGDRSTRGRTRILGSGLTLEIAS